MKKTKNTRESKNTGSSVVDLPRARVAEVEGLLETAEHALARAEDAVAAVDPSDAEVLDVALRDRAMARERRDLLRERLAFANRALAAANEAAERERLEQRRSERRVNREQAQHGVGVINAKVLAFVQELREEIHIQFEIEELGRVMDIEFGDPPEPRSFWASVRLGEELLSAANSPAVREESFRAKNEARAADWRKANGE
jgi:hypothetical protein